MCLWAPETRWVSISLDVCNHVRRVSVGPKDQVSIHWTFVCSHVRRVSVGPKDQVSTHWTFVCSHVRRVSVGPRD